MCRREVLSNDLIPPQVCKRLITHCLSRSIQLQVDLQWVDLAGNKDDG